MDVKVCPKCNAENKVTSASCSNCYSSLEGVGVTQSQKADEPVVVKPQEEQPAAQRPAAVPLTGPAGQAPPGPYGPPPSPGPDPRTWRERPAPAKKSSSAAAIVLILILVLGGAAFALWHFVFSKSGPEQAVRGFFDAVKAKDAEKAKSYLSESTVSMMEAFGGQDAMAKAFSQPGAQEQGEVNIIKTSYEGENAIVEAEAAGVMAKGLSAGMQSAELVLVKEEGAWKIDLMQTVTRMMGKFMKQGGKPPTPPPGAGGK